MLVLEYARGVDLVDFLQSRDSLSLQEVQVLYTQILLAVQFLHENAIVHRDIKADNLMVDPDSGQVKLVDFGYAVRFDQPKLDFCGTYYYAAPEMFALWKGWGESTRMTTGWTCGPWDPAVRTVDRGCPLDPEYGACLHLVFRAVVPPDAQGVVE